MQLKETQIRRQFNEAVKIQQKQYKALLAQRLQGLTKADQKELGQKLKDEQMRRVQNLGRQYEERISEMMEQQNVSIIPFRIVYFRPQINVKHKLIS